MIRRRDLRLAAVLRPIVRETPTPPTALCARAYARQLHDERDLPAGTFETQFTFAQELTESVKLARNCLLVVSLPASDTPGSRIAASSSRPDIPGNFWSLTTHAASLQASLAKTCSADRTITDKKADYLLALKENQGSLCADVADFFADPALASACPQGRRIEAGHGRIEERLARAADAAWLAGRHPRWAGLRSLAAISATRTDKNRRDLNRDAALYLLPAARPGPAAHPLPVPLEHREQPALAA